MPTAEREKEVKRSESEDIITVAKPKAPSPPGSKLGDFYGLEGVNNEVAPGTGDNANEIIPQVNPSEEIKLSPDQMLSPDQKQIVEKYAIGLKENNLNEQHIDPEVTKSFYTLLRGAEESKNEELIDEIYGPLFDILKEWPQELVDRYNAPFPEARPQNEAKQIEIDNTSPGGDDYIADNTTSNDNAETKQEISKNKSTGLLKRFQATVKAGREGTKRRSKQVRDAAKEASSRIKSAVGPLAKVASQAILIGNTGNVNQKKFKQNEEAKLPSSLDSKDFDPNALEAKQPEFTSDQNYQEKFIKEEEANLPPSLGFEDFDTNALEAGYENATPDAGAQDQKVGKKFIARGREFAKRYLERDKKDKPAELTGAQKDIVDKYMEVSTAGRKHDHDKDKVKADFNQLMSELEPAQIIEVGKYVYKKFKYSPYEITTAFNKAEKEINKARREERRAKIKIPRKIKIRRKQKDESIAGPESISAADPEVFVDSLDNEMKTYQDFADSDDERSMNASEERTADTKSISADDPVTTSEVDLGNATAEAQDIVDSGVSTSDAVATSAANSEVSVGSRDNEMETPQNFAEAIDFDLSGKYWESLCKDKSFRKNVIEEVKAEVLQKATEMDLTNKQASDEKLIEKAVRSILPKMINAKRVEDGYRVRLSHPHINRMLSRNKGFGNYLVVKVRDEVVKKIQEKGLSQSTSPRPKSKTWFGGIKARSKKEIKREAKKARGDGRMLNIAQYNIR